MCITNTRRNSTFKLIPRSPSFFQSEEVRDVSPDSHKMPLIHHQHLSDHRVKSLLPGFTAKNHIRHFAQHNYHDHANDVPSSRDTAPSKGGVVTPFPRKLHDMLDKIDADGHSGVVSWQPHGRCFVVHKPREFVDKIMPTYFRQTKLSSFQRQLNLYGFCRITKGNDKGGYYHELFIRGRPWLCNRMSRTRVKGTGVRTASSPETEPDFYAMPYVPPLPTQQYAPDIIQSLVQVPASNNVQEYLPDNIKSVDTTAELTADDFFNDSLGDLLKDFDLPFDIDEGFCVPDTDIEFGELLDKLVE